MGMNKLQYYIQEKLKIGSKSKIDAHDNMNLLNEILYVLGINNKNYLQYPKDRLEFFKDEIQNWISKHHINEVKYYADKDDVELYGDLYVKENKDIISHFEKDFESHEKELKDEYGQSHHIYSNDYCEFRYTEKEMIITIQDPTWNMHLRFYIVKANEED